MYAETSLSDEIDRFQSSVTATISAQIRYKAIVSEVETTGHFCNCLLYSG